MDLWLQGLESISKSWPWWVLRDVRFRYSAIHLNDASRINDPANTQPARRYYMTLRRPLLAFLASAICMLSASLYATEIPEGFTPLFNGKDLTGWHGRPHFDPRDLAKNASRDA